MTARYRRCVITRLAIAAMLLLPVSPSFGMSGSTWLQDCRQFGVMTLKERRTLHLEKRALFQDCRRVSATAWCRAGYIAIDRIHIPEERVAEVNSTLPKVCPHPLIESHPLEIALDYWNKKTVPIWRRWFAVDGMLLEAFASRWPECISTRKRLNVLPSGDDLDNCIAFHMPNWSD